MKALGIIPARDGSKGVPGKNIKLLNGKPLLAYTAEYALKCNGLDRVVLSTDSEEFAKIGEQYGLEVPFLRPKHLAQDNSSSIDVVLHALEYYESKKNFFDVVVLLQPTSPFRDANLLTNCLLEMKEKNADSLITVQKIPEKFNPHWVFEKDVHGFLKIATGDSRIITRRQELPDGFYRDGQIYITSVDVLRNQKSFYGNRLASYINMGIGSTINIDTLDDWEKAENFIKQID